MNSMLSLYDLASSVQMDQKEKDKQRSSFVYGSTKIENDKVTKEIVKEAERKIASSGK